MSSRNRVGVGLLAVALAGSVLSTVVISGPAAADPGDRAFGVPAKPTATADPTTGSAANGSAVNGSAAKSKRAGVHRLTLVTGDRIEVNDGQVSLLPDAARKGISISTFRVGEKLLVIPSDAFALYGAGKLDERLFDVNLLIDDGFADRADLPLIVTHDATAKAATRKSLTDGGATLGAELPAARALAVRAKHAKATGVWNSLTTGTGKERKLRSGIGKVWLDGIARPTLAVSVPQIGAPTAWAAGYDGTGIKVAVLDSGIDTSHPDLTGKVIASQNFTSEAGGDLVGHGTHVASTIAGSGAASGGTFKGVAPGASLLNGKVCTATTGCPESAIINGMTWAAQQGADVINMSLGGMDGVGVDPMEAAVNNLTATYGSLFVVASGNSFYPRSLAVSSPGSADAALTVGAVDPGDNVTYFSNQGPRVGDTALKPDITAPGMAITAARSSTSPGSGDYTTMSGTSMATPHVAGAAAILAQRRPTWTPAQIKSGLMSTANYNNNFSTFQQGAGRVNVAMAYNQRVLTSPASISLGRQQWPHTDDPVLTRTVTYTNTGTDGVGLTLSLHTHDPTGALAPAGMFALSTNYVSIPAGGTGTVTLTVNTNIAGPDGHYGGYIVGTGQAGTLKVNTPFAVDRAGEGYEIAFTHLNRSGQPQGGYDFGLLPTDPTKPFLVHNNLGPGPLHIWVPKGTYLQYSRIPEPTGADASIVVNPRVVINGSTPTSQTISAVGGNPVVANVPAGNAQNFLTEVGAQLTESGTTVSAGSLIIQGTAYTRRLGSGTVAGLVSKLRLVKAVPSSGSVLHNSPTVYNVGWYLTGTFPTGYNQTLLQSQLARVNATFAAGAAGTTGYSDAPTQMTNGTRFRTSLSYGISFDLPFSRTEWYNTNGSARWQPKFSEQSPGGTLVDLFGDYRTYTANTVTAEAWNKPVHGPSFGGIDLDQEWATRQGDYMAAWPPMVGDGDGHGGHGQYSSASSVLRQGTTEINRNDHGVFITGSLSPSLTQYTLESSAIRAAPATLSTQVHCLWTFQTSTAPTNVFHRLPLWYASVKPALDATHSAPRNVTFSVPVSARYQSGSPVVGLSTYTVEYSFDDGTNWGTATLTGSAENRTASIPHPNAAGFVTLRVTLTDLAGNGVVQTMVRAYKIA